MRINVQRWAALLLCLLTAVSSSDVTAADAGDERQLEIARDLEQQRRYPEARAELEAFVAANSNHAAAALTRLR